MRRLIASSQRLTEASRKPYSPENIVVSCPMNIEPNPSTTLSPEAIAQLVKGHKEFLAFLERRVESRAVAEDILQAAFTRGLERGGDVQATRTVLARDAVDHTHRVGAGAWKTAQRPCTSARTAASASRTNSASDHIS